MAGQESEDEPTSNDSSTEGPSRRDAALDDNDPMNPSAWYGEPNVCGSCIAWRPDDPRPGEEVASGTCKLRATLHRVPASLKKCSIYKPRGVFRYDPGRASPTRKRKSGAVKVLRRGADGELVPTREPRTTAPVYRDRPEPEVEVIVERIGAPEEQGELFTEEDWGSREPRPERPVYAAPKEIDLGGDEGTPAIRQSIVELLRKEHGRSPREIHSKFRMGSAVARTADGTEVSIPAERFFHVLDRLRSSLDTLQDAVEKQPKLASDREELVALVRRMHGSFTTFNAIFSGREDYFSGKE